MSDQRVFEALKYALGLPSCDDPAELRRLGLQKNHHREEIKYAAKQALQRLENAHVRFSEDERAQAAKQIKQSARELLAAFDTKNSPADVAKKPAVPVFKSAANDANASTSDTSKPKLVAKPVAPEKLVARVVAPAPPPIADPSGTPSQRTNDIPFQAVPATRLHRGSARPWLGWALLILLMAGCGGAVGAIYWFRDEPYFAFLSEIFEKLDLKSEANGLQPELDQKNNPAPTDPNNPPNTGPNAGPDTNPNTEPKNPSPAPTQPPPKDVNSGNPFTNVKPPNPGTPGTKPTPPAQPDDKNPDAKEPSAGTRVAVLRQLELSLVAIAAGQSEMAQSCLDRAKEAAGNAAMFQDALALVEQLHTWRDEVKATVAARVPLLSNREELPVDDTVVSLITATRKTLVVRAAGQRREYEPFDLPWSMTCAVLEVTNSDNLPEDDARKLVAQILRRSADRAEQASTLSTKVQELLTSGIDSTAYTAEALQNLLSYLEARADLLRLCPKPAPMPRLATADWSPWYEAADQSFKSDRELRARAKNLSISRYELEELVWAKTDLASTESVARAQLMIHHIFVERKDMIAVLDNLSRCEQLLVMEADHEMWTDLWRAILGAKPTDEDLVRLLELIVSAIDGGEFGPTSIDSLSKIGRQLAQRLSDRNLKQEWLKKF